MLPHHRPYLSYLVRLWGETSQGRLVWRAALESVQSGEQQQFASYAIYRVVDASEIGRLAGIS